MKIKKYIAPTMPEAMHQVRKDLGEAAVILDSREIKTKGWFGLFAKRNIEVLAAIDPQPNQKKTKAKTAAKPANPGPKRQTNPPVFSAAMKDADDRLSLANEYPHPIEQAIAKLKQNGLDQQAQSELLEVLLEAYYKEDQALTVDDLMEVAKEYFKQKFIPYVTETTKKSKRIFLVGPTGVGKTTTLAKLAAEAKIKNQKKVAFITLDTYRIAAIEQLKTYAKILDIPIEVAYNEEDLKKAKDQFEEMDLILVDTAGRNYMKNEYIDQIKKTVGFDQHDELVCVLSLTAKEEDMNEIFQQFTKLPVKSFIFTKVDETTSSGQLYNLWRKSPFYIRNLTIGQDVPDDILPVNEDVLAGLMIGEKSW